MPKTLPKFTKKLIIWYLENKRNLPWRDTTDPYRIWLSEIILQQTRVSQGLPYYERFLEHFPKVQDLASADESEVLKLWQGLGYYSRARNLHRTAKMVVDTYKGIFPNSYSELLKLKGVGDYTASAIASICFHEPVAVVDGNVYRVLSRVFGMETPIDSTKGFKEFKQLAQELIDPEHPGTFNQALMEFGARYCVPSNPNCEDCIFKDTCIGFQTNSVGEYPVKSKKTKVQIRYFNYLVFLDAQGRTLLEKRTGKGIWQNLYQFPLIESKREIQVGELRKHHDFLERISEYEISSIVTYNDGLITHKLSHQHLKIQFWIVELENLPQGGIESKELHQKPVPVVLANFISKFPPFQL